MKTTLSILVLLSVAAVVSAQFGAALYQRQGDGTCSDFTFGTCNACSFCGQTRYYMCTSDGDDIDCISSQYSNCQNHDSHPSIHHLECGQLDACEIGYQQKFAVDFEVQSTSTLAAFSEPHGRDSYVTLSSTHGNVQGHVGNVVFASGSSDVRYEVTLNETTYLTSAGPCNFGAQCSHGSLTYSAEIVSLVNSTSTPELAGTRIEIHSDGLVGLKNADSSGSTTFTALVGDELNLGSDELSDVVLEIQGSGSSYVLSNLHITRLDTNRPVLYFDIENGAASEYDYITCSWERPGGSYWSYWDFDFAEEQEQEAGPGQADRSQASNSTATATAYPTASPTVSPSQTPSMAPTVLSSSSPSSSRSRTSSPSRSKSRGPSCSPLPLTPIQSESDYVRCNFDRLLNSFGSFNSFEFYSFYSFAWDVDVVEKPVKRLIGAIGDFFGTFRL